MQLGDAEVKTLADALCSSESIQITRLDLSRNRFGPKGAKALACWLARTQTLEELILEENSIKSDGLIYLADALITNKSLKTLNFNFNKIEDEGAIYLIRVLTLATQLIDIYGIQTASTNTQTTLALLSLESFGNFIEPLTEFNLSQAIETLNHTRQKCLQQDKTVQRI